MLNIDVSFQPLTSTPRGDPQSLAFAPTPAKEPLKTNGNVPEPLPETPKRPATKGTSGPPVYYPPNHDMFTKKDAPILVSILHRSCIVKNRSNTLIINIEINSHGHWKGNLREKVKLLLRKPKLKEEVPTVELRSSQFACPSAVPCLVSSCKFRKRTVCRHRDFYTCL